MSCLKKSFESRQRGRAFAIGITITLAVTARSIAHETDQFSVPVGRQMADLRMFFAEDVASRIGEAVVSLNERIHRTLRNGQPTQATHQFYAPRTVAKSVFFQFPAVVLHVEQLEAELHSAKARNKYPGLIVAYRPMYWIYHHPLLLIDFTKLVRLTRCSTVMIDGHHLGTDKLVHFVHMGYLYHQTYLSAIEAGRNEAEATRRAVSLSTGGNPFLSEGAVLGLLSSGIWSNADLAANYCGLKFFRNLTEPVVLRGETRPPLLVREGPYWRLNDHVRPNSDFFTWFVSDHWDEALVPNKYATGIISGCVRQELKRRCPDVLEWYRDDHGRRRSRDDFRRITADLTTYYGEDYGFGGDINEMVTVANVCFDKPAPYVTQENFSSGASVVLAADAARPTEPRLSSATAQLRYASCSGNVARVKEIVAGGAPVNESDIDGETPLHCAARWGHAAVAEFLLNQGADPNARAAYGLTPLHLAVREYRPETAKILLQNGANANSADAFGCGPLHDAAARGFTVIVAQLLQGGADVSAADDGGTTPLHRAARLGHTLTVKLLLQAGADRAARNITGRVPSDEAASRGHDDVLGLLKANR